MSYDLSKQADRNKYLALRKLQIEAQSKQIKTPQGIITLSASIQSQDVLACGCIVQRWTNQDGASIVERDWHNPISDPHTDGAVLES